MTDSKFTAAKTNGVGRLDLEHIECLKKFIFFNVSLLKKCMVQVEPNLTIAIGLVMQEKNDILWT